VRKFNFLLPARLSGALLPVFSFSEPALPARTSPPRPPGGTHRHTTMTDAEILERLKACIILKDFTDKELATFLHLLDTVEYPAGECIVRQDEQSDAMYLLVQGSARVTHRRDGRNVTLAELKGGDFFGELGLVDHGLRSADVEALEPCVLLRIPEASLSALSGVFPQAAFKFVISIGRLLVERLRKSNQRYIDSLLFPD
jgi:CRP-like cAMP-binding protein